jgi:hypothetical protein
VSWLNASQNRFAAEIVANGTTWNQAVIPLVLLDGNSCVLPLASGNNSPVELIAGEAPQEFTSASQTGPRKSVFSGRVTSDDIGSVAGRWVTAIC